MIIKTIKSISKKWANHHEEKAEFHLEKARKGGIIAVYKLFNRYYLKSFFGPFFTFVFPIVLLGIMGAIMDVKYVLPGIIAMSALGTGMQGLPFSILELKKSVLLKRIGASPVRPSVFTTVIITYYTFTIVLSIFWLLLWSLIFFRDTSLFNPMGTVIGFFGFLYGNLLNIIISIALGFTIATVSKSEVQAQTIGMLLYFPSTFLSGQFISISAIANSEAMNWISRFVPFRYTTMLIVESWSGDTHMHFMNEAINIHANPFAIHDFRTFNTPTIDFKNVHWTKSLADAIPKNHNWTSVIYDKADHILGYVVPYVMLVAAGIFSIKKFSWSAAR